MSDTARLVEELLVSRRKPEVTYEPFPYFWVDDYLPADLYTELYREFPSRAVVKDSDEPGKRIIDPRRQSFAECLASAPHWAALVEALRSEIFLADIEAFLRPALVRARGLAGRRRWRQRADGRGIRPLIDRPVEFTCQFSVLPSGAYLYPHTDKPEKLVSFLLYFADPEWRPEYGGATDLYRVKNAKHDRNWSGRAVSFESVDIVFRSEFRPNRLLVFVKTRNSYHGVAPVRTPDGLLRKSFNFNVILPFDRWGHVGKRIVDSYRWRTESPRFREFAELPPPMNLW